MPVTHAEIINAKPREKSYRLFDGRGLYLEIAPSGGRWVAIQIPIQGVVRQAFADLGTRSWGQDHPPT